MLNTEFVSATIIVTRVMKVRRKKPNCEWDRTYPIEKTASEMYELRNLESSPQNPRFPAQSFLITDARLSEMRFVQDRIDLWRRRGGTGVCRDRNSGSVTKIGKYRKQTCVSMFLVLGLGKVCENSHRVRVVRP
jgi:hypothetical protein